MFFAVLSLQNLNPVYAFSSDWFMDVFCKCVKSIQSPTASDSFDAYVDEVVRYLTLTVYHRVSYGILASHSLPFAFKLCSMLLIHEDRSLNSTTIIRRSEWMALLRDYFAPDDSLATESQYSGKPSASPYKKLKPDQISYEMWEGAMLLDRALHSFNGLLMHIVHNPDLWVEFSKASAPWLLSFDNEQVLYEGSLTKSKRRGSSVIPFARSKMSRFQVLILVNLFCPNQLAASAKWFIEEEMGAEYVMRVPRDLETINQLTSSVNPALIIIAPSQFMLHRFTVSDSLDLIQWNLDILSFLARCP